MRIDDDWLLTAARAAIHLPTATAVVSDLHLGYGDARRRGGEAVPSPNVAVALAPLRPVLVKHGVRRFVVAGDLFEASAKMELVDQMLVWLGDLSVELTAVVPGNHDRGIAQLAQRLSLYPAGFQVGNATVVNGDAKLPEGFVVQGHEHPWLRWSPRLSAPCYLLGANRLILPAFSTDAAGVNVLHQTRWGSYRCGVIVGDEVLDFGLVADLPARVSH